MVDTSLDITPKKKEHKASSKEHAINKDKRREMVKGIFKYYELPGGQLEFNLILEKGDPAEPYKLRDGEVCEVPLFVAKHLNKNGWYPVHTFATDEKGIPSQKIGQKIRRFGFQSLEFVDIDDLSEVGNSIITVENI